MNELIFFSHLIMVILFTIACLKLGKDVLLASIAIQAMLSNLFVLKQVTLFGLHVTSCEVYTIGCLLGINLMQEYYPKSDVKPALLTYFGSLIFFMAMAQFHLRYTPVGTTAADLAYEEILSPSLRIFLASITTSVICMTLDIKFFQWIKDRYTTLSLPARLCTSALAIQLLDTFLFTGLGLWGLVTYPWQLMSFSYVIKVITILSMSVVVGSIKRLPLLKI